MSKYDSVLAYDMSTLNVIFIVAQTGSICYHFHTGTCREQVSFVAICDFMLSKESTTALQRKDISKHMRKGLMFLTSMKKNRGPMVLSRSPEYLVYTEMQSKTPGSDLNLR